MGSNYSEGKFEGALAAFDQVLDELLDTPLGELGFECMGEASVELYRLHARWDAARCRLIDRADALLAGPGTGNRSIAQHIGRGSNADLRLVREDAKHGRWLQDFPLFAEALAAGEITTAHVRRLREVDKLSTRVLLQRDQQMLIDSAKTVDVKQYTQVLGYWLNAADPDGPEPEDPYVGNRLSMHRNADGTMKGSFFLDSLSAEAVQNAIDREVEQLRKRNVENEVHQPASQLRAMALANLTVRGAANPETGIPAPVLSIVLGEQVAETIVESFNTGTNPDEWPIDPTDVDGRCEFIDGTPVHPAQVARIFPIAQFRRFVFNTENKVVSTTSKSRTFPAWMRHILLLQTRGRCSAPGCDAPHRWLQADHINPASNGGPTNLQNGQPLCGPHNRMKSDKPPDQPEQDAA